jgi:hypothetical protein
MLLYDRPVIFPEFLWDLIGGGCVQERLLDLDATHLSSYASLWPVYNLPEMFKERISR